MKEGRKEGKKEAENQILEKVSAGGTRLWCLNWKVIVIAKEISAKKQMLK